MIVAIYARVSTVDQHCELQTAELGAYAARSGWETVSYIEHASGKAGSKRPVLAKLLADARLKKFDAVLVWKIDRFGRSLSDFIANVNTLDQAGIRFIVPTQAIDTDQRSPISRLFMHLLAILAEFERELIVERTNAGVQEYRRAYARGAVGKERCSKSGKNLPVGRPKRIFRRGEAAEMRKAGRSWRDIAATLHVSVTTIRDALKAAA